MRNAAVIERANATYVEGLDREPVVSVITPIFNRTHTLPKTLDAVMSQTFTDFEYILVDDGSSDCPEAIIGEFMEAAPFPCLFLQKPNGGVHTARNLGVSRSRGRFILFLDSDDEITPDCIERFLNAWTEIPENVRGGGCLKKIR